MKKHADKDCCISYMRKIQPCFQEKDFNQTQHDLETCDKMAAYILDTFPVFCDTTFFFFNLWSK